MDGQTGQIGVVAAVITVLEQEPGPELELVPTLLRLAEEIPVLDLLLTRIAVTINVVSCFVIICQVSFWPNIQLKPKDERLASGLV